MQKVTLPHDYIPGKQGRPTLVIYNAEIGTVNEWAKRLGCSFKTLKDRLESMPVERAMQPRIRPVPPQPETTNERNKIIPGTMGRYGEPMMVIYNGKKQTVDQWAKELGYTPAYLYAKLNTLPLDKAMRRQRGSKRRPMPRRTEPAKNANPDDHYNPRKGNKGGSTVTWQGEEKTVTRWAEELGYTRAAMMQRLRNLPLDKAMQPKQIPRVALPENRGAQKTIVGKAGKKTTFDLKILPSGITEAPPLL